MLTILNSFVKARSSFSKSLNVDSKSSQSFSHLLVSHHNIGASNTLPCFFFDNFHTHRCIRAVRHIPAKILVHIPGGWNINLFHPGLDFRLILIMSAYADVEIFCPLTLIHAVGRSQDVLVRD